MTSALRVVCFVITRKDVNQRFGMRGSAVDEKHLGSFVLSWEEFSCLLELFTR